MTCPICNEKLPRQKCKSQNGKVFEVPYKYCPNCLPSDHPRLQCRAQTMANQYPEKVKIIYECPCDDQNKKKHHFDYSFPYDVFLLCQRCHMEEHKKINRLKKFYDSCHHTDHARLRAIGGDHGYQKV